MDTKDSHSVVVLPQLGWGIWKYLKTMCLDYLVLREDPLTFYLSQKFIKLIGINITVDSF